MNRLTLNRRSVVTLRQRRPLRTFMDCLKQANRPNNRHWVFCFIMKQNSLRVLLQTNPENRADAGAKVVMKSLQPARWVCGKNRGCILFQYGTTQIKSHEILIRLS